jgi:hypothetical protein
MRECFAVRVLIQNCLTNKFLSQNKLWTADISHAENFEKTLRAWAEIDERKLSGVRIVLNFGEGVPDVPLASVGTHSACGKTLRLRTVAQQNRFR